MTVRYRGLDVYKCGPWTQGPVFLQQLRLLEGYNLRKLGHNSTQYIHTVMEAAKLAFADREWITICVWSVFDTMAILAPPWSAGG